MFLAVANGADLEGDTGAQTLKGAGRYEGTLGDHHGTARGGGNHAGGSCRAPGPISTG